ncbi:MAG: hypothetical protein ABIH92_00495 [Nanoarchaeota archaeon]
MFTKKRSALWVMLFVLFVGQANAASFGVTPSSYEIQFEPGLEETFYFSYDSDNPNLVFEVSLRGDLADYVTLDKQNFSGGRGRVAVSMKLPDAIEVPGPHRILVGAKPVKGEEGGTVGIVANVNGLILVHVPYPGKYADVKFSIENSNQGEDTEYSLEIYSRGREAINTFSRIEVYDSGDELVETFSLGSHAVQPGNSLKIESELGTAGFGSGNYRAVAVVAYSGREGSAESSFRIGELFVGISNYTSAVEKDKINPFTVEVESFWNDQLDNVFAEVSLVGRDVSFRTPSISLKGWHRAKLFGHLDVTGIEEDSMLANIVVYYGDKTTEETVNLQLFDGELEINYLIVVLVAVIILLLLFFGYMYLKLRKLEKKSGKKKK